MRPAGHRDREHAVRVHQMKNWGKVTPHVARMVLVLNDAADGMQHDICVGQHHALWEAGRARGVVHFTGHLAHPGLVDRFDRVEAAGRVAARHIDRRRVGTGLYPCERR